MTGCELSGPLPAGWVLLELLLEADTGAGFTDVVVVEELAGDAELAGGSAAEEGPALVLADGGTGSVDAAGFVPLTGEALLSCAGTCGCAWLTGENDVPFWPIARAPASKKNTTCPDNLRTSASLLLTG